VVVRHRGAAVHGEVRHWRVYKPAERHRCISLRSAGPPRWRCWRSAQPTACWSSQSRRWSRREGLPPTRALARSPPCRRPRCRTTASVSRRRRGWAGPVSSASASCEEGSDAALSNPCTRRKLQCRPPAPRAALPHGRPAAAAPQASARPPVLRPSQLDHPHRAAAMRPKSQPQEARSTRGGSAGPSPSGEGALKGALAPASRAGGQAGLPAAAALPLSSVRSGQAAHRHGIDAPRRVIRARRSATAPPAPRQARADMRAARVAILRHKKKTPLKVHIRGVSSYFKSSYFKT
jgi:hypothetical protein